jgi:hypothetical protein
MGGSAKTKQNSTSTYTPTAQAAGLYTNVINQAQAAQSPYNPATAKTVAGFTDPQTQAFGQIAGNQGVWQPGVTAGADMVNQAGQGIGAADISKFYNPFENDVIGATLRQMSERDAMQTRDYTANQVAQQGLGGNGFGIGRAQLAGDQAQARNETIAGLRSTGWKEALGAAQADKTRGLAAGQASAGIGQLMSQLGYTDAGQMLNAGNQQQAQQQTVNDTASTNALNEQLFPMQQAQWLSSIASGIGPLTGGTTVSKGSAEQSQGKGIGNAIGGALTLASMASDERVKENPIPIGHTNDGQPIYEFNYKGDPRRHIGLMAQDVERGNHPEAVSEGVGGIKMVNYDRALVDAKADGGGVGSLGQGLIGWADMKPAQVRWPDAPDIQAPAMEKEEFDPQASWDMGKKAGAGIGDIMGKLGLGGSGMPAAASPAGGALAASGLQGLGGAGSAGGMASMGGIGSLLGMFGFADGGEVDPFKPTSEEMHALEMQESGGRDILGPVTRSGERAEGPRQLMPATQRDPGFGVRPLNQALTGDERLAEHRRFSDDYYGAMVRRYNGDRDAARIAYNGGPRRADDWLKAGRNDAVIPAESANYYKQIEGRMGPRAATLVAKASSAGGDQPAGDPYKGKADRATGGLLKRTFGIDFNPLNLTEPERKALMVAGLSMLSHGNVGRGGLAGMQYLSGVEAGEREEAREASKLSQQMRVDQRAVEAAARAERREGRADEREDRLASSDEKRLDLAQKEYDLKTKQGPGKSDAAKRAIDAGLTPGTPEYNDYVLKGPEKAAKAAELPGEIGARIGLGREFKKDVPDLKTRIGKFTPTDYADLAIGRGNAAEVWRRIESGRDALVRGLTGAGIGVAEAQNQANRYQIGVTDRPETMISKLEGLVRDLDAVERGAITGKTGEMARDYVDTAGAAKVNAPRPAGTDDQLKAWAADAIKKGAPAATVSQRLQQWGVSP